MRSMLDELFESWFLLDPEIHTEVSGEKDTWIDSLVVLRLTGSQGEIHFLYSPDVIKFPIEYWRLAEFYDSQRVLPEKPEDPGCEFLWWMVRLLKNVYLGDATSGLDIINHILKVGTKPFREELGRRLGITLKSWTYIKPERQHKI